MVASFEQLRQTYLDDILQIIESVMESEPGDSSLSEMGAYHMSTGGKRIRAVLPLAVADAIGESPEKTLPFAAACELLHNATLVHDDLQDGDTTRRQQKAVWAKFGAERAINLGDAMLYWPLLACDRLDTKEAQKHAITNRMVRSTLRVIDGQEREFLLQSRYIDNSGDGFNAPDLPEYTRMVEGKTGGLFSLPIAGAAQLCGSDTAVIEALESAATHLGVLFQIQDDLLDLYGDKGREHQGADIQEGKVSILVVHHFQLTDADAPRGGRWLREILRRERQSIDKTTINEVAGAFRNSGALEAACQEIRRRQGLAARQPALREHAGLSRLIEAISDLMLAPIEHVLNEYEGDTHER